MHARPLLSIATLVTVTACGSADITDNPSADAGPDAGEEVCVLESGTPGVGPFSSPDDFPRDGCDPSFDFADPDGLWQVYRPGDFAATPIRLELTCEAGLSASFGSIIDSVGAGYTRISDEGWLIYSRMGGGGFAQTQAVNLCAVTEDGVAGHSVDCFEFMDGGEDILYCTQGDFEMTRFGRAEGENESSNIDLVTTFSGNEGSPWPAAFTANVALDGDLAYVARSTDGLRIVDVSDPSAPTEVGHLPAGQNDFNDVMIVSHDSKRYALLASNYVGMVVADVTDPASPSIIDTVNPFSGQFTGVHRLITDQVGDVTRVYLADGGLAQLFILDVTDPESISILGNYVASNPEWGFHASSAENGIVYVNAGFGGLLVVDTTTPETPTLLGRWESGGYSHMSWPATIGEKTIALHGDEGWDAHAEVIDVDPDSDTFMQVLGSYQTRENVSIHNFVIVGSTAYVAYYQDGVRILDLSDPSNPTLLGYYNTWDPETAPGAAFEGAVDVEVDEESGLVYVADTPGGLLILEPSLAE